MVDDEVQRQMVHSEDNSLVESFALLSLSSYKYQCTDDGTNLILSLNSHSSIGRKKGVQQLATLLHKQVCSLYINSVHLHASLLCVRCMC